VSGAGFLDGTGTASAFFDPLGIALNAAASVALVADRSNGVVRQIIVSSGAVTTIAGKAGSASSLGVDGYGTSAAFSTRQGLRWMLLEQ